MATTDNTIKTINCTDGLKPLVRNQYFYGKLLTVRDFENEQSYFIKKQRLMNKHIHGEGIVCGLRVEAVVGSATKIKITSGIALDCCGREIIVPEDIEIDISKEKKPFWITIEYSERGKELVASTTNANSCEENCCYSRVEEWYKIDIVSKRPEFCDEISWNCSTDIVENVQQTCLEKDDYPLILAKVSVSSDGIEIDNTMSMGENEPLEKKLVYSNPKLYELMKCNKQEEESLITIEKLSWEHGKDNKREELTNLTITFSEAIKCVYTNQCDKNKNEFKNFPEVFKLEIIFSYEKEVYSTHIILGVLSITDNNKTLNFQPNLNNFSREDINGDIQFRVSLNCDFIRGNSTDKLIYSGPYNFELPKQTSILISPMVEIKNITTLSVPQNNLTHQNRGGNFESWFYMTNETKKCADLVLVDVTIEKNENIIIHIKNIGNMDINSTVATLSSNAYKLKKEFEISKIGAGVKQEIKIKNENNTWVTMIQKDSIILELNINNNEECNHDNNKYKITYHHSNENKPFTFELLKK